MRPSTMRTTRGAALLAAALVLPSLLGAQSPLRSTQPTGLFVARGAAAHDASLAELPAAPDTTVPHEGQPALSRAEMFPVRAVELQAPPEPAVHKFWDRENGILFAVSAGWAAADFGVTRSNLANGGRELNPIARLFTGSTPALATNFALETAGVIGISYFFHKTGHHQLERMTSYVDISASAGAVAYGLTHR